MTCEEAFKIKSYKLRGSGAIIRHHNPAYEGIINSSFVDEPDHSNVAPPPPPVQDYSCNVVAKPSLQVHQYHQFNNGHVQTCSDTETERSIGEIIIPMTTFRTTSSRRGRVSDADQILDASQLQT